MNAYTMLQLIRDRVGEAVTSSGIGGASNLFMPDGSMLMQLNLAQRRAWMEMNMQMNEYLTTTSDLTPVASVVTLPSNCAKPVYMEEISSGYPIYLDGSIGEKRVLEQGGMHAIRTGNTFEITLDDYVSPVRLWYRKRITDLLASYADTGSTTNTLVVKASMSPNATNDYYNGQTLEVVSGTGAGSYTITDYVASTRTLTLTGTFSTDSAFGTVSELPVEAEEYIMEQVIVSYLSKPSAAIDPKYFSFAMSNLQMAQKVFREWISTQQTTHRRTRMTQAI